LKNDCLICKFRRVGMAFPIESSCSLGSVVTINQLTLYQNGSVYRINIFVYVTAVTIINVGD